MESKPFLDSADKVLTLLYRVCKFAGLGILTVFVAGAFAYPAWAHQKLRDMGLSLKEVNIFGVKLAADETFNIAGALADVRLDLEATKNQLGQGPGVEALTKALTNLNHVQASLTKQNAALKDVQESAGIALPQVPDTGWLYVGRLAEDGTFAIGPRLDPTATKLDGDAIRRIRLRSDAPVVQNGDECIRRTLDEIHPPTLEDLQSVQALLSPNPAHSLEVLQTATCPSKGNGKWLYARIRIPKDDVKFARFETLLRR